MAKRRDDDAISRLREMQLPLWTEADLARWAAMPHARSTDPETSHGEISARRARSMMLRLLAVYAKGPATADEAARAAGFTADDGAWKRVSDLFGLGLITGTGQTRLGDHGKPQAVRAITRAGLLVAGLGDDEQPETW